LALAKHDLVHNGYVCLVPSLPQTLFSLVTDRCKTFSRHRTGPLPYRTLSVF
jgi:hypothetical protein